MVARPWQRRDRLARTGAGVLVEVGVEHATAPVREWRHLVGSPEHGVKTVSMPWAADRSRYTAAFEDEVAAWLGEARILGGSKRMR